MKDRQAVAMLSALAQASRLAVFRKLAAKGGPVTAGELARALKVPANTLSFHLKELLQAGLLEARREGRSMFYSLHQKNVGRLMSYLWDDCCGGRPELCGWPSATSAECPSADCC